MTELTPKMKRQLKKLWRDRPFKRQYEDLLYLRLLIKERIEEVAIDGVIGLDWDKMDCDHARWGGHSHIPASVMHFIAWENDFYDGAEGPQSAFIVSPREETGTAWERDLALEAFENGHPHCIHL